ncbi:unnamed protein product [Camellia sinensis]
MSDAMRWKRSNFVLISVKSYYEARLGHKGSSFSRRAIWDTWALSRETFFVWCAVHGNILTIDNLIKRRGFKMGKFSKRPRKEQDSDAGSQEESESEEMLNVENEYDDDGNEYSDDNDEEDDSVEENEEDEDGDDQNDIRKNVEMEELDKELTDLRHQEH